MHLYIRKKRWKVLFFVFFIAFVVSVLCVFKIGSSVNDKLIDYAKVEAMKICKYIVNYAVNSKDVSSIDFSNLLVETKDSSGNVLSVDFNSSEVNMALNKITETIISYFKAVENGNLDKIGLSLNLLTNTKISKLKKGVVLEIPIGVISSNAFLTNLGPKIPMKLALTGEVVSYVSTEVNSYGINNALITVYVNVEVSEQVILPLSSDKVTVVQKIPISLKIINGVVPNYYWGNIMGNSSSYSK